MSNENTVNVNNDSILDSIKKVLGISENCVDFDTDIIMHINSVFSVLTQLDIGPKDSSGKTTGFFIENYSKKWSDFLSDDIKIQEIKSYMYLKVKLLFDPPASTSILESMKNIAQEYEWRMYVEKGGY